MKKTIALLLALAMMLSMAACGGNNADTPSAPSQTESPAQSNAPNTTDTPNTPEGPAVDARGRYPAETVKIGFVNYDTTAELTLSIQRYFNYLDDYFNFEVIWSESLASAEEEFAFIEQCAAAGCQAIIGYYNEGHEESVRLCKDLGMFYWGQGQDEGIMNTYGTDPIYLGSYYVGNADYEYGKGCVEALVAAGCHKIIMVSGGKDQGVPMFVDRYQGAMDAIADQQAAGYDIEVVYEVPGWPGTEEFSAHQASALATDADGLCSLLTALMWIQPMQTSGKFGQIKVAAVDTLSADVLAMFEAGMYVGVTAEIFDAFGLAIPMILNAVDGYGDRQRTADGKAPLIDAGWWLVTNVEDASYYASVEGEGGTWVFDADDVRSILYAYNPDLTIEDMSALYTAVSAEEIQARR